MSETINKAELLAFLEHVLMHKYLTMPEGENPHDDSGAKRVLRSQGFWEAITIIKEFKGI